MKDTRSKQSSTQVSSILKKCFTFPMNKSKQNFGRTLDISYILPNVIVCSNPAISYPKLIYRNSLCDLIEYLNCTHGKNRWKIYNIKSEQASSDYVEHDVFSLAQKDKKVNSTSIDLVGDYMIEEKNGLIELEECIWKKGWLDHCPPTFLRLQEVIDDMECQLNKSEKNVVVVHCRMGKGRSGTLVIAYLMKYLICPLNEGKEIFKNARFKSGVSKGVTILSQLRYLKYHETYLRYNLSEREYILDQLRNKEKNFQFQLSSVELIKPNSIILPSKNCNSIMLKVQTYSEGMNGLELLNTPDIIDNNWKVELLSNKNNFKSYDDCNIKRLVLTCPLDIPFDISDIRIVFGINNHYNYKLRPKKSKKSDIDNKEELLKSEHQKHHLSMTNTITNSVTNITSYSRLWFNLYWESLKCSQTLSNTNYQIEELKYEQSLGHEFHIKINWEDLDGPKGTNKKGIKLFETAIIKWKIK